MIPIVMTGNSLTVGKSEEVACSDRLYEMYFIIKNIKLEVSSTPDNV